MPDDPWQKAHDDFGGALEKLDTAGPSATDEIAPLCSEFVTRVKDLIEKYRPFSNGQKDSPAALGFYSNSPEVALKRLAEQQKTCTCGAKEGLRIARHEKLGLGLYCLRCLPKEKKKK